jgi:acetyltransferase-like isoleucine patch superfamily enzyme
MVADDGGIGDHCTLSGVSFAVGVDGRLTIGDFCHFSGAVLLCEASVTIGSHVLLGWNVTIADSDFHPIDPVLRVQDAVACSNIGGGRPRPPIRHEPVVIEDDVYVGPMATILKGVRVGRGSFVEPGSLLTRDVPPMSRVMGNPARVVGTVEPTAEEA